MECAAIVCMVEASLFIFLGGGPGVREGTPTKRQATQQGCLPSLLGGRDKEVEIV
jgi:hypothetical protein